MYKVLLLTERTTAHTLLRQTAGGQGRVGEYQFFVNDLTVEPDFVVVRDRTFREEATLRVAPENTLLVVGEPASIALFPRGFCRQFGRVLTCQSEMQGANVEHTHAVLPWYVGTDFSARPPVVRRTYDDFAQSAPPAKTKLISLIASAKTHTLGHQRRLDFALRLKAHYGDRLDLFGRGLADFGDKWDCLAPYKYHLALENTAARDYWTEKLADAFLTDTFPIYYGCPNVSDYFPAESFAPISVDDFEGAVRTIDSLLAAEAWERSLEARAEAKRLVLGQYNMFQTIAAACARLDANAPKQRVTLRPAQSFFSWRHAYRQLVGVPLARLRYLLHQ